MSAARYDADHHISNEGNPVDDELAGHGFDSVEDLPVPLFEPEVPFGDPPPHGIWSHEEYMWYVEVGRPFVEQVRSAKLGDLVISEEALNASPELDAWHAGVGPMPRDTWEPPPARVRLLPQPVFRAWRPRPVLKSRRPRRTVRRRTRAPARPQEPDRPPSRTVKRAGRWVR
jgi:hypothetical protein